VTEPSLSWPACPAPFNLAAHVLAKAGDDPDRIALAVLGLSGAERWSYGQLERAVLGLAGALAARHLPPGARVLMRLGNTADFPILFLAAIAADLVAVPTSAQLTAPEITAIAARVKPALIVAADGVALPEHQTCPVMGLAELRDLMGHAAAQPVPGDPDRPAYIVFTSGTTAAPRGVVHAHRAVWARGMMRGGWSGLTPADRLLHAGAMNWTYTLGTGLCDPWSVGATALVPAAGITSAQLPLLLRRHDATLFAAVPGVFRQILKGPPPALPKLRHALSAGEALPDTLRTAWREATGTDIHQAFGQSEISTFLSGSPDRPAPEGSLGFAQPGRRLALVEDGRQVDEGPGEIAVAADDPGLMLGYLDDPGAGRARLTPDGAWFLTGDRGLLTPDGAIAYLGREDDQMNAGGFRVSPAEVETAMLSHPGLEEAAAAEIRIRPDATVIALFYTGAAELPDAALAAHAAGRLARYKCPRLFVHLASLARGANGKLLRRRLAEDYEAAHGSA